MPIMPCRALFLCLFVLLGISCTRDVEFFCDEDTPCLPRYPDRPFCDTTGQYEDAGVRNTCVANPYDAGVDDTPDAADAASAECTSNSDCDDDDFCDGVETCDGTSCVDGTAPTCAVSCNEEFDRCNDCVPDTTSCAGGVQIVCDADGLVVSQTTCPLGCFTDGTRCTDVDPSNQLGAYLDLTEGEFDLVLTDGATINTVTGVVINGDSSRVNVTSALLAGPSGGVAIRVLIVASADIGDVGVDGEAALAVVSHGDVVIRGRFDAGGYTNSNGPGAYDTGACRGGEATYTTSNDAVGGGGGGFGGAGAKGGNNSTGTGGARGEVSGNHALVPLRGGCRGGGATALNLFGGAGGAVQLVSRTAIRVVAGGEIAASGGGGTYRNGAFDPAEGCTPANASGGGSGGGVLLEAPAVSVVGPAGIHANGGTGGCAFQTGQGGQLSTLPAAGPVCSGTGRGNGGDGAAKLATSAGPGLDGPSGNCQTGGGGGGGLGRIRINTATGAFIPGSGSIISPAPSVGLLATR